MNAIFDVNNFILKTSTELVRLKSQGKKHYYGFDLLFEKKATGENIKRYYEGLGYIVELKWCKSCATTTNKADLIIEITSNVKGE